MQIPARDAQRFQTRGNVHSVAEHVRPVAEHVARVDADPEREALLGRERVHAASHALLKRERELDRFDGAGELAQEAVTDRLDEATAKCCEQRSDHGLLDGLDQPKGADLVRLHQAAVADHIRRHDRRKLPPQDIVALRVDTRARGLRKGHP